MTPGTHNQHTNLWMLHKFHQEYTIMTIVTELICKYICKICSTYKVAILNAWPNFHDINWDKYII